MEDQGVRRSNTLMQFSLLLNTCMDFAYHYTPFLQGLDLDGQEKFVLDANKTIRNYQNPIIDERIQQWRSSERKEMEDLLDVFVTLQDSDGKPLLTPDEIKNQIAEIMILPVDNPLNAIEWAMGEMLNQPEILAKTIEELDRVVGKDRLVTGRRGCAAALLGSAMITMLLARMLQCSTWTPPANVTKIVLTETLDKLTPTTPISAFVTPRLATHLYPTSP
ncbi:hypothetical protein GH714_018182 [Hevea brasiliensis]|uniref:Uncharacterized protein n=1 Tax=Hevea brasiliensis TaxID=3981 RepID=A0A6A6K5G2_HEVBR|nr:hypothetical protein GH714_018182 [Hevea brasiliensis]